MPIHDDAPADSAPAEAPKPQNMAEQIIALTKEQVAPESWQNGASFRHVDGRLGGGGLSPFR